MNRRGQVISLQADGDPNETSNELSKNEFLTVNNTQQWLVLKEKCALKFIFNRIGVKWRSNIPAVKVQIAFLAQIPIHHYANDIQKR